MGFNQASEEAIITFRIKPMKSIILMAARLYGSTNVRRVRWMSNYSQKQEFQKNAFVHY